MVARSEVYTIQGSTWTSKTRRQKQQNGKRHKKRQQRDKKYGENRVGSRRGEKASIRDASKHGTIDVDISESSCELNDKANRTGRRKKRRRTAPSHSRTSSEGESDQSFSEQSRGRSPRGLPGRTQVLRAREHKENASHDGCASSAAQSHPAEQCHRESRSSSNSSKPPWRQ